MMGVTTKLDGIPSEGLGGLRLGVSPLEMANAYATLASGGKRHKPIAIQKVEFPDGKSENLGKPKPSACSPTASPTRRRRSSSRTSSAAPATKANIGCPAAGKTGTTDNFNDAWFVGYTPNLATSVWVGYPNALHRDARGPRDQRRRRHVPCADLGRLHADREGRPVQRLPAADAPGELLALLRHATRRTGQSSDRNYGTGQQGTGDGRQLRRWPELPRLRPAPLRAAAAAGTAAYTLAPDTVHRWHGRNRPVARRGPAGSGPPPRAHWARTPRPRPPRSRSTPRSRRCRRRRVEPGPRHGAASDGAGRSPDWLLGPLRVFGLEGADGPLAGPLFYAGLWVALGALRGGARPRPRPRDCER